MLSTFAEQLGQLKIIPVLTIQTIDEALSVCAALQAGGINGVEITLRSPIAMDAIKAVKQQFTNFIVAAGTIKTTQDIETLAKLDIGFGVSPGLNKELVSCAQANNFAFLPGIATPSELMQGLALGLTEFKLFPAEAVGGIPLLKSLASPFPEAKFCPTGGVGTDNYKTYLALPNVLCVGGSWMVAPDLIANKQWSRVEELSRACMAGM
jgi:2-dehydro-3-deoxyphosphogluconate aldolase/(4S)-4-hydroxy-2-oxoglutarate aldolase